MELYNFYSFFKISNTAEMRTTLLEKGHTYTILGTILVAPEGLNLALYGEKDALKKFCVYLQKLTLQSFTPFVTKFEKDALAPFDKFKVKIKKEIVKIGMPALNPANPACTTGTYVDPWQWNTIIKNKNTITIDTRNNYEYYIGHFKNAINPDINFFTDFPHFVRTYFNKKDITNVPIAMYCTGGIRCEKATSFMLKHNFKNVYHLQHGILEYFKVIPKEESLWEGACYVFDNRIAIDKTMHTIKLTSNTIDKKLHQLKNASRHEKHTYSKIMSCVG